MSKVTSLTPPPRNSAFNPDNRALVQHLVLLELALETAVDRLERILCILESATGLHAMSKREAALHPAPAPVQSIPGLIPSSPFRVFRALVDPIEVSTPVSSLQPPERKPHAHP